MKAMKRREYGTMDAIKDTFIRIVRRSIFFWISGLVGLAMVVYGKELTTIGLGILILLFTITLAFSCQDPDCCSEDEETEVVYSSAISGLGAALVDFICSWSRK